MNEKFTPGESADGLVLGSVETTRAVSGRIEKVTENVVSARAAVKSTKPFAVIDALDPTARLRLMIETAVNFRRNNQDAPVRGAELAVNEVLRLRALTEELTTSADYWQRDSSAAWDKCEERRLQVVELRKIVNELRRPWWKKFLNNAPKQSLAARLRQLSDTYFDRA